MRGNPSCRKKKGRARSALSVATSLSHSSLLPRDARTPCGDAQGALGLAEAPGTGTDAGAPRRWGGNRTLFECDEKRSLFYRCARRDFHTLHPSSRDGAQLVFHFHRFHYYYALASLDC